MGGEGEPRRGWWWCEEGRGRRASERREGGEVGHMGGAEEGKRMERTRKSSPPRALHNFGKGRQERVAFACMCTRLGTGNGSSL